MKKLYIILNIFLFLFSNINISLAKEDCPTISTPKIEVYSSYGKLRYDLSKSNSYITALAKQNGKVEKGMFASGLSTIKIESDIDFASRTLKIKNYYCVYPEAISVFVGYQTPIIHIAKNLRKGSCKFNMVKRHEQAHQQINITTLKYFMPKFSQFAKKLALNIKPIKVSSKTKANKATQFMLEKYHADFKQIVDIFKSELKIENGKLDTKTNYKIESNICK